MSFAAAPLAGSSSRAGLARSTTDNPAVVATVAWLGLCALIIVSPFEALRPIIRLPGQSLSTVEAALLAAFAAWAIALASARVLPAWRTPLTLPWLAVILTMTIAALAAPAYRFNALNMVGRLTLAFILYLLVVNGVTTVSRLRSVLGATAVAGAAVATLAILEYLGVEPILRMLAAFRAWVALVGAQVRASGPLQYPTIASMFLEIALAFVLGLMLLALDARRRVQAVALGVLALAIAQGIIVTFTRAGLITAVTTLGIIGWLRYRRGGFDRGMAAIAVVAALFATQVLTSRSFEYPASPDDDRDDGSVVQGRGAGAEPHRAGHWQPNGRAGPPEKHRRRDLGLDGTRIRSGCPTTGCSTAKTPS